MFLNHSVVDCLCLTSASTYVSIVLLMLSAATCKTIHQRCKVMQLAILFVLLDYRCFWLH